MKSTITCVTAVWLVAAVPALVHAQTGAAANPSATAKIQRTLNRSTAIPAKGLFVGDQLSDAAKQRLTDLVIDAIGLDVEVALVVPTGPWQIDGSGDVERRLTPARLESVRRYLSERGIDPKRIYVESRVDAKLKEPQLVVELVGRESRN
jgi:OOP family OmpA-OmpF porin